MADQPWEDYADAAYLLDTDTLLAKRGSGGVEVLASAIVKKDVSGNVGVGNSSVAAIDFTIFGSLANFYFRTTATGNEIGTDNNQPVKIRTNGLERVHVGTSGNFGIGVTPSFVFHARTASDTTKALIGGVSKAVRVQTTASDCRLEGVSHDNASFQPLVVGGSFVSMSESGAITFNFTGGHLLPSNDNGRNLGSGSFRLAAIYLGAAPIVTSDERSKTDIGEIPDEWLDAWNDVQWSRFKMIEGKRWHVGLVAQQVHSAFAAHDIDAFEIGLCCYDAWEEQRELIYETVTKTRKVPSVEYVEVAKGADGSPLLSPREVMVDEEYEEAVDTGETRVTLEAGDRWGLRYDECQAIEAAWHRRELSRMTARLQLLEAAQ